MKLANILKSIAIATALALFAGAASAQKVEVLH
ncbi:MAG: hypothetical protein ETSY2_11110 [Candidatus Entotheonella gemina]|uniref:Uncharacterized protein n=2 Tax=Candidatus Entotheonella TaxID=93171 RepID=W4MCV2_9BACT|nr:MAG: hypothetical protein ETSY2_11110 [Candidatus Entotheonella gemina]